MQDALPAFDALNAPIWQWAAQRPQAAAFHEGSVTLTYGELAPLVGKAAVHLDRLGPGARLRSQRRGAAARLGAGQLWPRGQVADSWSVMAKFDGELANGAQLCAGTARLPYAW